jgi:hypothetical protein
VALFAFAIGVRWGESAPKILRGPRLSTGRRALKAYAKAARAECRALGEGVEFVSGSRMDIRELAAFAALFLARDGDVPFSAEVSRAAA